MVGEWRWLVKNQVLQSRKDPAWTICRINVGTVNHPAYRYALTHAHKEVARSERLYEMKDKGEELMGVYL